MTKFARLQRVHIIIVPDIIRALDNVDHFLQKPRGILAVTVEAGDKIGETATPVYAKWSRSAMILNVRTTMLNIVESNNIIKNPLHRRK